MCRHVNVLLFHAVCLLFACAVTFCVSQSVSLTITPLSCFPKCHSENTDSNGKHSKHNGQMCDYCMNVMVQCLTVSIWGKLQSCMAADGCNLHSVNLRDDAALYCSTRYLLEWKAANTRCNKELYKSLIIYVLLYIALYVIVIVTLQLCNLQLVIFLRTTYLQ